LNVPSESAPELLDEFDNAAADEDYDGMLRTYQDLDDEYRVIETEETAAQRRAIFGRTVTEATSSEHDALDRYVNTAIGVDMSRAGFLMAAGASIGDPAAADIEQARTSAMNLRSQEEEFVRAREAVEPVFDNFDAPAILEFLAQSVPSGLHPKGVPFEISVTARNVGDTAAENVTLEWESEATLEPTSYSLGTVSTGEEFTREFEVGSEQAGEFTVTFKLTSSNAESATIDASFEIPDKAGFAKRAKRAVQTVHDRIDESNEVTGGHEQSLLSKLEATERKIDHTLRFLNDERVKQANQMLEVAARHLGSLLNQFEHKFGTDESQDRHDNGRGPSNKGKGNRKGGPPSVSEAFERSITGRVERIIDLLAATEQAKM
jgi:hypothetical protein